MHIYTAPPASNIHRELPKAIQQAQQHNSTVEMCFNRCVIHVNGDSDTELILRDYYRWGQRYIPSPVGPYPKEKLTSSDEANGKQHRKDYYTKEAQKHIFVLRDEYESDDEKAYSLSQLTISLQESGKSLTDINTDKEEYAEWQLRYGRQ